MDTSTTSDSPSSAQLFDILIAGLGLVMISVPETSDIAIASGRQLDELRRLDPRMYKTLLWEGSTRVELTIWTNPSEPIPEVIHDLITQSTCFPRVDLYDPEVLVPFLEVCLPGYDDPQHMGLADTILGEIAEILGPHFQASIIEPEYTEEGLIIAPEDSSGIRIFACPS